MHPEIAWERAEIGVCQWRKTGWPFKVYNGTDGGVIPPNNQVFIDRYNRTKERQRIIHVGNDRECAKLSKELSNGPRLALAACVKRALEYALAKLSRVNNAEEKLFQRF